MTACQNWRVLSDQWLSRVSNAASRKFAQCFEINGLAEFRTRASGAAVEARKGDRATECGPVERAGFGELSFSRIREKVGYPVICD